MVSVESDMVSTQKENNTQTKTQRIGSEITLKLIKQTDITYQDMWTAPVRKATQMNKKKGTEHEKPKPELADPHKNW
ncbi:hypothetical protein ROHU_004232 [Labeo rohita]|uniref:Uncharacterized protein n=1 Tax=Labeo rohita TaxID=84645 RepID=A0A498NPE0_LABRO|nr:hypothetical protein ROHU_004215 [Labeo rohita]RXN33929.1 hypothetical protein ROHU_004232 [Labeo rohita]